MTLVCCTSKVATWLEITTRDSSLCLRFGSIEAVFHKFKSYNLPLPPLVLICQELPCATERRNIHVSYIIVYEMFKGKIFISAKIHKISVPQTFRLYSTILYTVSTENRYMYIHDSLT